LQRNTASWGIVLRFCSLIICSAEGFFGWFHTEDALPAPRKALADNAVSVIAYPVDCTEKITFIDNLGKPVPPA
jgi:hypothetical protein